MGLRVNPNESNTHYSTGIVRHMIHFFQVEESKATFDRSRSYEVNDLDVCVGMTMESDFSGKTFWIVGATGGIGERVAVSLRERGANLVLSARTSDRLAGLAVRLDAEWIAVDAGDADRMLETAQIILRTQGALDGIGNCVGSILLKPAHLTSAEEWDSTLRQNLGSAFAVVRAAGRTMSKKGGSVVLISSAAAQVGLPNHEAIAAAKAGIEGLVRSAAATYARRGIRFNAVAPGLVRTPLSAGILTSPAAEDRSASMHPMGRIGEPEDIADAVVWFLSPSQTWITGQVLAVDGGLSHLRSNA